jgi:hypothetical protein
MGTNASALRHRITDHTATSQPASHHRPRCRVAAADHIADHIAGIGA